MADLGYQNNPWFHELFDIRGKGVPVFLNSRFWAGMTTTQRAESMNSFLNKYLSNKATLAKFVVQFDAALMTLWENEHDADHDSKYKNPTLITCLPMLRDSNTNCMFYKCRAELARCMELQCEFGSQVDNNAIYTVTDFALNRT